MLTHHSLLQEGRFSVSTRSWSENGALPKQKSGFWGGGRREMLMNEISIPSFWKLKTMHMGKCCLYPPAQNEVNSELFFSMNIIFVSSAVYLTLHFTSGHCLLNFWLPVCLVFCHLHHVFRVNLIGTGSCIRSDIEPTVNKKELSF